MPTDALVTMLKKEVPDLIAIYQFGSQAKGATNKESDVDVAFLASRPLQAIQRFDLEQELASLVKKNVDLIDLRESSTVMRMQVISSGCCLFSIDDAEREQFETFVYSSYARLNEERRLILDDIQKRGSVYAR